MIEKITLDMLTKHSVSVKKEYLQELNGKYERIGNIHRKAYVNSINGREEIENELDEIYKNAIFSVWGGRPTVDESITQ